MEIYKVGNSFKATLSSSRKTDCDHQFKQVFDRKLDEINAASTPAFVDNKKNVIEQSEKILNLLDHYSETLADPAKSLKDIQPLVDGIEKEINFIESETKNQMYDDKALDKIVKDLTVTAKVAMYKFHRGDYI